MYFFLLFKTNLFIYRKLSERPLAQELEQRNILKVQGADSLAKKNMDETRKMLLRKVSINLFIYIVFFFFLVVLPSYS